MIGRDIEINRESKIIKRAISCKFCKLPQGQVHIIGTHPEYKFARLEDQKCGDCVIRQEQDAIIKGNPTSDRAKAIIKDRLESMEKKLEMEGYINHIKDPNKYKGDYSYLFKSKGIKKGHGVVS